MGKEERMGREMGAEGGRGRLRWRDWSVAGGL